jgi:hypothetical protein
MSSFNRMDYNIFSVPWYRQQLDQDCDSRVHGYMTAFAVPPRPKT